MAYPLRTLGVLCVSAVVLATPSKRSDAKDAELAQRNPRLSQFDFRAN